MYYAALFDNVSHPCHRGGMSLGSLSSSQGLVNAFTSTKFGMPEHEVREKLAGQTGTHVDLVTFMLEVVNLRCDSKTVHSESLNPIIKGMSIDQLVDRAKSILHRTCLWREEVLSCTPCNVVDATYSMPEDVEGAEIWSGPLHIYASLKHAHHWNLLRTWQLYSIAVIIRGLSWKESRPGQDQTAISGALADYWKQLQDIVDAVCADVPYYLGIHRELPTQLRDVDVTRLDGRGGLSLWVWLVQCFSIEALPDKQNRWLRSRMRYIGSKVKFRWAAFLAENTSQSLIFDKYKSHEDVLQHLTPGFLDAHKTPGHT